MLIDEMDNRVRANYGNLPNSAYIIGRDGRVFHKQPWMDSKLIEPPLKALLEMEGRGGENPLLFATGSFRPVGGGRANNVRPLSDYKDAPVKVADESEIAWLKDLGEARKLSREAGVPLFVEFYFDACAYCAAMAKGPLRDATVVGLTRKYVSVKVDLETEAGVALAEQLELIGSPDFVIYSSGGEVVLKQTGYAEADVMTNLLRQGLEMTHSASSSK